MFNLELSFAATFWLGFGAGAVSLFVLLAVVVIIAAVRKQNKSMRGRE